jgi:hypothetical protein
VATAAATAVTVATVTTAVALLGVAPTVLSAQVPTEQHVATFPVGLRPASLPGDALVSYSARFSRAPASFAVPHPATEALRAHGGRSPTLTGAMTGALVGLVVGAGATYFVLQQGGSTALCDHARNQDAIDVSYCRGLYAAGAVAGAGIGAAIGGRVGRSARGR